MNDDPQVTSGGTVQPAVLPSKSSKKSGLKSKLPIIIIVLLLLAAGGLAYLWQSESKQAKGQADKVAQLESEQAAQATKVTELEKQLEERKETTGEVNIKKEQFQSVFLTGGQVYFGKITNISETQVTLTDIYYLSEDGAALHKLGEEVHGPEDVMYIERSKVDFWENLKTDGEVAKAIDEYVKSKQ